MIYAGPYTGAHSCTGGPTPGARALMAWFLARYANLGARNDGIYNCRDVRGGDVYSVHAEGRAADLGHALGAPWAKTLAEQLREHSAELGIQCVISERRIWSSKYPDRWRTYDGVDPHTGHLHVELTWDAARTLTAARITAALTTTSQAGSGLPNVQEDDMPTAAEIVDELLNRNLTPSAAQPLEFGAAVLQARNGAVSAVTEPRLQAYINFLTAWHEQRTLRLLAKLSGDTAALAKADDDIKAAVAAAVESSSSSADPRAVADAVVAELAGRLSAPVKGA